MRPSSSLIAALTLTSLAGCAEPPAPPAAATAVAGAGAGTEASGTVWDRYTRAAGGDALLAVTGLRITGVSVDATLGSNRRLTIEAAPPAKYRQREASGQADPRQLRTLIGFDGTVGWWAGNTVLAGDGLSPDPAVRQRAFTDAGRQNFINSVAGILPLWLRDAGITFTELGVLQDGPDRGAPALAMTVDDRPAGRLVFDPDTHLPRRIVVPYQRHIRPEGGEYSVEFFDYRDAGSGVLLPFRISREFRAPGEDAPVWVQWLISAYQINPVFDPGTFLPPRS